MKKIAFFGLGRMGLPMAKRLIAAGYSLRTMVHRNPTPADELRALGAVVYKFPREVVRGADLVVTILPADKEIEQVLLDPAVFEAVEPGSAVIEMSTATPGCVRKVADRYAEKGVRFFDAPVSGGVKGAAEGKLTIIGGGNAALLEEIRPVLEQMAKKIFLVGGVGDGKAVKSINQIMVSANTLVVAEGLRYARHLGIEPEKMFEVISASTGASAALTAKFHKMAAEDFSPGFTLALMKKDLNIALSQAGEIPLPLVTLARQIYLMLGEECEKQDYTVVYKAFVKCMEEELPAKSAAE